MFLFANKSRLPSLKVQWVIGALLAMLPLLAAGIYGFYVMDHHNRAQRQLVLVSAQVAETGAAISDQAKDLERVARQYQVLKDDRLRQVFMQKRRVLGERLQQMARVTEATNIPLKLEKIATDFHFIETRLFQPSGDGEDLGEQFEQVHDTVKQSNQQAAGWVQRQLDDLQAKYDQSQWHLLVIGSWALPATLVLVWLVSFMVLRPIYQLSAAIRDMGKGYWRTPIHISGSNEMVLLGENLRWMQQQLLTLESQKHTFLQQITHELKTPLAAIMEAGSLLQDEVPGGLNQSQRQVLTILQTNANHLQGLIQQLLDYNSVVKDDTQQMKTMDVSRYLRDKLLDMQGLAETRSIQLLLQGECLNLPIDIVRVGMIVRNLVSNAVQLTPSGKSVIVRWGKEKAHWWLSVTDEGPGVQLQEQERLFEPFYQGGNKRQGSLKGSGIGLAIVKECCEFLNATIRVKNVESNQTGETVVEGACFSVYFPIKESDLELSDSMVAESAIN